MLFPFSQTLLEHDRLRARRTHSASELERVQTAFRCVPLIQSLPIAIFSSGSLARLEIGKKSDLDLFITADANSNISHLAEAELLGNLIRLNNSLGYPEFSSDGEYLKINSLQELKDKTGSRKDDSENMFTARLLLILESRPIAHAERYESHLKAIVENYFRDKRGKASFKPLFLVNDILRYWRTLCLNYEERRSDPSRPWRKKNINLKFARMMTVFSTVLPLLVGEGDTPESVIRLCNQIPCNVLPWDWND